MDITTLVNKLKELCVAGALLNATAPRMCVWHRFDVNKDPIISVDLNRFIWIVDGEFQYLVDFKDCSISITDYDTIVLDYYGMIDITLVISK
jgi:hypothetical protein